MLPILPKDGVGPSLRGRSRQSMASAACTSRATRRRDSMGPCTCGPQPLWLLSPETRSIAAQRNEHPYRQCQHCCDSALIRAKRFEPGRDATSQRHREAGSPKVAYRLWASSFHGLSDHPHGTRDPGSQVLCFACEALPARLKHPSMPGAVHRNPQPTSSETEFFHCCRPGTQRSVWDQALDAGRPRVYPPPRSIQSCKNLSVPSQTEFCRLSFRPEDNSRRDVLRGHTA